MYLTNGEQTGILLEMIEDLAELVKGDPASINIAFHMIVARAKRHPDWPATARRREEELKVKAEALEKAQQVVDVGPSIGAAPAYVEEVSNG